MIEKNFSKNKILASLPQDEYKILFLHLEKIPLTSGQIIYHKDQEIDYVYFPLHSMISLVSSSSNQSITEIALIGNEGFVGLPLFLGVNYSSLDAIVQIPDSAMRLSSKIFLKECQRAGEFRRLLLLYTQARLTQISQKAVCKCHHSITKQFAFWLLYAHDCVDQDELPVTQKFIAEMLGVRRSSITDVARQFQSEKIISYRRGNISILNRGLLESTACECYSYVKSEFSKLLNFT